MSNVAIFVGQMVKPFNNELSSTFPSQKSGIVEKKWLLWGMRGGNHGG